MATKVQQLEIFFLRSKALLWDLDRGNKSVDKIHSLLKADCRELLTTAPTIEEIPTDTEGAPLPEAPGHRRELNEGLPMPDTWETDPILQALSSLINNIWNENFELARQDTQQINRCLAMGEKPNKDLVRNFLPYIFQLATEGTL